MDVKLINPFIEATVNTLQMMASITAVPGEVTLKENRKTWGVITGIIGLVSSEHSGSMIISFNEAAILKIASQILGVTYAGINEDVTDVVGELTNIVSGSAKNALAESGINLDMALPVVIEGKSVEINQLKGAVIAVPFDIPDGKFVIEANLLKV